VGESQAIPIEKKKEKEERATTTGVTSDPDNGHELRFTPLVHAE